MKSQNLNPLSTRESESEGYGPGIGSVGTSIDFDSDEEITAYQQCPLDKGDGQICEACQ